MDEDAQKTQFMTLIAEGEKLYNNGEPDKALEFYAQALTLQPANKHALVARSKCYLRIGNVEAALNDANLSLKEDKLFHRGLYQKAEALYQKGDFEMALVNFHRGCKKRPELDEFRLGIEKSKEAIINSLGASEIKFASQGKGKKSDEHRLRMATKKYGGVRNGLTGHPTNAAEERAQKILLGELYQDKEYLERLELDMDLMNARISNKEHVGDLVKSGIDYFESKTEFWRQQKPLYSRKVNTCNTSPASDPITDTFTTIKQMEESGNYQKAAELADEEIKRINRCTAKQLQQAALRVGHDLIHKQALEYELCLAAGKTASQYVDHNPSDEKAADQARIYFEKSVELSKAGIKKIKSTSSGTKTHQDVMKHNHSKALFELGHLYVVTNKLIDAIKVWEDREVLLANNRDELVVLYHDIGRAQLSLNNFEKAREYANLSYNMVVDPVWKMNVMVLLAEIHLASKQIDEAKKVLENCLVIAGEQKDHSAAKAVTDLLERLRVRV